VDRFHGPPGAVPAGGFRSGRAPAICGRTMTLTLTLILAAAFCALAALAAWRGARPPNPMKGPRLMPWRLIMLTSAALALLMIVHLANLVGVTTGGGRP
jgi:hypothetical protein